MSKKPTVPGEYEAVVDKLTEILVEEYDCSPESITVDSTIWADGDFNILAKSGHQGDYIEALDAYERNIRHVVRYKHFEGEIRYRSHSTLEQSEETLEAWCP